MGIDRGRVAFVLALTLLAPAGAAAWGRHFTHDDTFIWQRVPRRFALHASPARDRDRPVPLVVVFPAGATPLEFERQTGLAHELDREGGAVLLFPELAGGGPAEASFLFECVARAEVTYRIDPTRVGALGVSGDGAACYYLAERLADQFSVVGIVSGGMAPAQLSRLAPAEPLSLFVAHGVEDPLVPFAGGLARVPVPRTPVAPVNAVARGWAGALGCGATQAVTWLPDRAPGDGTRVRLSVWDGGRGGSAVALYAVRGGGHGWPSPRGSGDDRMPHAGRRCRDFDATAAFVDFLLRHPKRGAAPGPRPPAPPR